MVGQMFALLSAIPVGVLITTLATLGAVMLFSWTGMLNGIAPCRPTTTGETKFGLAVAVGGVTEGVETERKVGATAVPTFCFILLPLSS